MKQIQVDAITTAETIKPLTPTPHHLRRHNLSLFESIMPQEYLNTIVYFSPDPSKTREHISNTLKTSLAEVLSIYYPLAGRVVDDNSYVDCHDQGALYLEANIKGSLNDDLISELDPSEICKFLSHDHKNMPAVGPLPLLVVQTNFFECGGLVIGMLLSHVVADALSLFTFLTSWASIARKVGEKDQGVHNFILPSFGAAKLFPCIDLTGLTPVKEEKKVTRRFVFSNDTILGLCKKYSTSGTHENGEELYDRSRPSRVEALSAFIWKRYIASTQIVQPHKTYRIAQAVNLRTRFDPPIQPSVFGSFAEMAIAIDESPDKDDHSKVVKTIRTSISNLSDPKTRELYKDGAQFIQVLKERCEWMNNENEVWVLFTSACRLCRFKDVDFGWGPLLAMHLYIPEMSASNVVLFKDTNDEKGIEAWIAFNDDDMTKFEVDPELLAHATRLA